MNKTNVLAVASALRSSALAERGIGFNMEFCMTVNSDYPDRTGHNCGTVACIVGWAYALAHPELSAAKLVERVSTAEARDWLGLSRGKGHKLFYEQGLTIALTDISPEHAATVLEHLAETGEVVWDLEAKPNG